MLQKRVTMRDVAKKAGVHRSTVSLALSKHPGIPASTRERIEKIARQLNFQRDPILSQLCHYRHGIKQPVYQATIAYVIRWKPTSRWRQKPFYRDFLQGARKRAERAGYQLEEFCIDGRDLTPAQLDKILYHRNIQGAIIAPLPVPRGHLRLNWSRLAAVAIGSSLARPFLHRVTAHHYRAMAMAYRALWKRGYRRVGLAVQKGYDDRSEGYFSSAYLRIQSQRKIQHSIPILHLETESLSQWMKNYHPDAIVSTTIAPYEELQMLGVKVPQDIGFALTDCEDRDGFFAGIWQNWDRIGSTAVDFVITQLQHQEYGIPDIPITLMVDSRWAPGKTVNERKARAG